MQISVLKKLLHPIKSLASLREKGLLEATSEQGAASDMYMENNDITTPDVEDEAVEEAAITQARETDAEPPAPTRAHLTSSVPRAARLPSGALSKGEMSELRQLFGGLSDTEIQRLYKKVTK